MKRGLVERSHRPRHRGVVVETVSARGRVEIVDVQRQLVDVAAGNSTPAAAARCCTSARQSLPDVFFREDGFKDDMTGPTRA